MNIFVLGLPCSGRTTISFSLAKDHNFHYIDTWVRSTFRHPYHNEPSHQYEEEYQSHLTKLLLAYPTLIIDHIQKIMRIRGAADFVIDGLFSPKDFTGLFDYRKDVVIFLNRTDNEHAYQDHENIGISVIRDYCFWLSSAGLLTKDRWLEYNFKIPGKEIANIKSMGARNSVFIVGSIDKAIEHIKERVREIVSR